MHRLAYSRGKTNRRRPFCRLPQNGSFIMDLETGEFDKLTRVNDCFELELEVMPYTEAESLLKASGF